MNGEISVLGESVSGRKRPNFLFWYYGQGIHELLEICKNFLFCAWRFFSIIELLITILSPWRRDVSPQTWRGFHPLKTAELIVGNLISRILGAIVRIVVICFGIVACLCILAGGIVISFFWIGPPIWAATLVYVLKDVTLIPFVVVAVFLVWIIFSFICYLNDTKTELVHMEADELFKHPVFQRISARFGMNSKRFPKEIFTNKELLDDFLKVHMLKYDDFLNIIEWELKNAQEKQDAQKFWRWENLSKIQPIGMQWRYGFTVNLDRYCQDLYAGDYGEYRKSKLVGRSDEYEVLKLVLKRPDQNCAMLYGRSGIGKKTLIHTLGRNIRQGKEKEFENMRVMILDLGRVISEAINRGEDVEEFLRVLFHEASYAGNIILVVENMENFMQRDMTTSHPDISAVLNEYLNVPSFQIIALSTSKEYHSLIEKHEEVVKYFEVIEMREPSEEETIAILLSQLNKYESQRILFTFRALREVIVSSGKYNWDFPLPERAIDLAMETLMFWQKKSDEQFVTEKVVADYLTLKTGVKHGDVDGGEQKTLLNLEKMLHEQVIGQEEAIKQVSEALRRARSGIGNSEKPIGSFLFLGPTGVGKTETAKALAKIYFGDEKRMIRLDMSEFQMPNSIDRLLGSSQLNQQGRLVTLIKDNPYSLLLLDEIEKAYPEILDIFLQILDEGFVTDAFGDKVNFRNTMIIATSNAGAALIKNMVEQEKPAGEIEEAVINYAIENNLFRPEFLNRFQGVIFFRPLNDKELTSVVRLQLQKFVRKVAKEKNIEIVFNDSVVENIIQKGYNPTFGARSLNRYIEETVEGIVAKKIISGEAKNGEKIDISL